ncbi:hypothetical protein ACVBEG_27390 [Pseudomonas sp. GG8]
MPEIYIALAAGEAGLFLRGAGVIFAGKSLRHGGGKNPVEAARLGCAILHGPDVDDFEEIYAALDNAGGGALVFDAETLAKQLALLFSDKAELRAMARAAAATAEDLAAPRPAPCRQSSLVPGDDRGKGRRGESLPQTSFSPQARRRTRVRRNRKQERS